MKTTKKLIPAVACLSLLVACNNAPRLVKENRVGVIELEGVTDVATYQDIFDDLYAQSGVETTVNELLKRVAEKVIAKDTYWSAENIEKAFNERINDTFNAFYGDTTYEKDGFFSEIKLVQNLRSQGYDIPESEESFEETITNLVGHKDLKPLLKHDYSDYISHLKDGYYVELMNEQYVHDVRSTTSTNFYTNKRVRKVEYFTYTTSSSIEKTKYSDIFNKIVKDNKDADFATVLSKVEFEWKCKQLDDLAKQFAVINKKAHEGTHVNAEEGFELPTEEFAGTTYATYLDAVKASEDKWEADEKYKFKDIYTEEGKKKLQESEITEAKDALASFSENGAHTIYVGYYQKQIEILTTNFYTETVYTTDSSNVVDSTVTDVVEDLKDANKFEGSKYLDVNGTGSAVYKSGANGYIFYVEAVNVKDDAGMRIADKQLATVSSNTKNAVYYYLTQLTEEKVLSIHNQEIYDYLNTTYGYGVED